MLSVNSCPHCSTRVPRTLTRCPVCGAPVGARQFDYGTSSVENKVTPMPQRKSRRSPSSPGGEMEPPPAA
jgi:hypothetical protein